MLAAALCTALFASAAMAVTDDASLRSEIAEGGTVTLENDITIEDSEGAVQVTKDVTLNLNGFTLKRNSSLNSHTFVIEVDGATLTIEDSINGGGRIESFNSNYDCARGISVGSVASDGSNPGNGGAVILKGGTISAEPNLDRMGYGIEVTADCSVAQESQTTASVTINNGAKIEAGYAGIFVQGKTAEVNIEGGEISAIAFGISGNGSTSGVNLGGTVININGGTITSEMGVGIFHPQDGTLTVNDGAITGYDGIQMKSGTLVVNGGIITGKGTNINDLTGTGNNDTGAAVSIISMGGATGSYAGNMNVTFNGGTLISEQENAVFEAQAADAVTKFESLTINGGTFTGAEGKSAVAMTNASDENTTITAGMFSTKLADCEGLAGLTNLPQTSTDENGNCYVVVNAESIAFETNAIELAMNETFTLRVIFTPDNTTEKALTWSSSDEKVATVDADGNITPVAPGTTTITAALADDDSIYDTCTVTVTEEEVPPTPPVTSDDVKPQPSGSGGGGCSAGFGALALLAALPLLRMRKK